MWRLEDELAGQSREGGEVAILREELGNKNVLVAEKEYFGGVDAKATF